MPYTFQFLWVPEQVLGLFTVLAVVDFVSLLSEERVEECMLSSFMTCLDDWSSHRPVKKVILFKMMQGEIRYEV